MVSFHVFNANEIKQKQNISQEIKEVALLWRTRPQRH